MSRLRLFDPGTGRRLLVTQVALAAVIGLRVALGPYRGLADQPAALFRPVSFLRALHGMPGLGAIVALQVVGTLAAALAVAGWRRRASFPVAWLCLLVLAGLRSSRGKVLHNDSLLLLAAVPFLLAPAARWRDREPSARFGWPVRTATVVVAGTYFFSGLAKLVHSGAAWVTTDNMRFVLYGAAGNGKVAFPGVPTWLAGQAALAHGLAAGVLLLELSFPAVVIARGRRVPAIYVAGAVAFHAGTWLALGLDYWAWAAVAIIVLVDWSDFVGRHLVGRDRGGRLSRYRLWWHPGFRLDAGNRAWSADVVPAERREKAEDRTCEKAGPNEPGPERAGPRQAGPNKAGPKKAGTDAAVSPRSPPSPFS